MQEEVRYPIRCCHDFVVLSFTELHKRPWISCYHHVIIDVDAFPPTSNMEGLKFKQKSASATQLG